MLDQSITLCNGNNFTFMYPDRCEYDIRDIAHALSKICRFGGHVEHFYSVAQHSVLVSQLVPEKFRREALMHDAAEALMGVDMPTPLKNLLPEFKRIEIIIDKSIRKKYGLPSDTSAEVKEADSIALLTEARDLMPHTEHSHYDKYRHISPHDKEICPLTPKQSFYFFIARYEKLTGSLTNNHETSSL